MAICLETHVGGGPNEEKVDNSNAVQLRRIFTDLRDKSEVLCNKLEALRVDIAKRDTKDGLSWLELKNHMLLSYLMDLNIVVQTKLRGKSIAESPAVRRLVEYRTVLERMRPIDQKLKYQIQKMQKIASTGKIEENDPLRFRANPDAFEFDNANGDKDSSRDGQDNDSAKTSGDDELLSRGALKKLPSSGATVATSGKPTVGLYVPPKLAPQQYLGDETEEARRDRQTERAKRRGLSASLIAELQREYYEGPVEIREEYNPHKEHLNKRKREREQYEEEHFVRLQVSKKERHANRLQGFAALDDITEFKGGPSDFNFEQGSPKRRKKGGNKKYAKKWGQKGFKGKQR
ncbi:neuroguidin-like [Tropilaelaps mercedesae]|uniref:Neuroguidin-like n=1 Tax=Tropilaelaps mercedesae TaxID=418985 RepID=A0A1V9XTT6_9ACAR|nr:neuroguidin-like [Tropilaelaps mercedesae]